MLRLQFFDTEESFEQTELLSPGEYQLTVGGGGDRATGPNGSDSSCIAMDFTMTFPNAASTPTPAASMAQAMIFPNPARDLATISFAGPIAGGVRIAVLEVGGRLVRDLGATNGASLRWDIRDQAGARVPPGVYSLRMGNRIGSRVTVLP